MKELKTYHIHKIIRSAHKNWDYDQGATFVCKKTIQVVAIDVNLELCAYKNYFINESGAYIEVSLKKNQPDRALFENGIKEGILIRAHSVYNQAGLMFLVIRVLNRIPGIGKIAHLLPYLGNSGFSHEGFRYIEFPREMCITIDKSQPLYIHIQVKGYITIGAHVILFVLDGTDDNECELEGCTEPINQVMHNSIET